MDNEECVTQQILTDCIDCTIIACTSFLTRVALLLSTPAAGVSAIQFVSALFIGGVYDLSVACLIVIPFVLQLWLQNDFIYRKKILPFVTGMFLLVMGYCFLRISYRRIITKSCITFCCII
ncbi:hypothetical protein [Chitinophaga pinensis]|uniref:Uncharacterized protein n=1 Tax=Chitinophaga pinensis TaxID=79329 RepID=A0A5C6LJJ6_9BACT|nr:hypothetical protein [Chitinophaga pinensis]TWV89736.1 hypothetical protein FEF09_29795 [Chitinophaga pinensis]